MVDWIGKRAPNDAFPWFSFCLRCPRLVVGEPRSEEMPVGITKAHQRKRTGNLAKLRTISLYNCSTADKYHRQNCGLICIYTNKNKWGVYPSMLTRLRGPDFIPPWQGCVWEIQVGSWNFDPWWAITIHHFLAVSVQITWGAWTAIQTAVRRHITPPIQELWQKDSWRVRIFIPPSGNKATLLPGCHWGPLRGSQEVSQTGRSQWRSSGEMKSQ